jgi:cysteine-rich repeat protein
MKTRLFMAALLGAALCTPGAQQAFAACVGAPNGIVDPGEACDGNGAGTPGQTATCDTDCSLAACGDGTLNTLAGEACDDGNTAFGDGCRGPGFGRACQVEGCGNGYVDCLPGKDVPACLNPANQEGCDGNNSGTPGQTATCDANCTPAVCGDRTVNAAAGEVCDDGNIAGGDGCSQNCNSLEICGNGLVDVGEQCDDANSVNCDACSNGCKNITGCGDGTLCAPEVCDDGNTVGGDGCSFACNSAEVCGNGIVDVGEACDDNNTVSGDGCDANCKLTGCQNGVVTAGEQCDDGNANNGDGCDNNCTPTGCGNGVTSAGEQCDFGKAICTTTNPLNPLNGSECGTVAGRQACNAAIGGSSCGFGNDDYDANYCRTTCRNASCGDHVLDAGETCDDGKGRGNPNTLDLLDAADSCPNGPAVPGGFACTLPTSNFCGDGIPLLADSRPDCSNPRTGALEGACPFGAALQQCDNGGPANPLLFATCNNDPTKSCNVDANCGPGGRCGNNNTASNACRTTCTPAGCGDDVQDTGESCDDGTAVCSGGSENGQSCGTQATYDACVNGGGSCIHKSTAADGSSAACFPGPGTCNTSYPGGQCRPGTCALATCGDGVVDAGEACDGGPNCTPVCTANVCGDGYTLGTEECDDGNTEFGDGCRGTGYARPCAIEACGNGDIDCLPGSGLAACLGGASEACDDNNTTSGDGCDANCTPTGCGNGIVTPPEVCDDGNANNNDACRNDCKLPICGDGFVNPGEGCDDGNTSWGDGCGIDCCSEVTTIPANSPVSTYTAAVTCHLDAIDSELPAVADKQERALQKKVDRARERYQQGLDRLAGGLSGCSKFKSSSKQLQSFRKKVDRFAARAAMTPALQQQLNGKADATIAILTKLLLQLGC